MSRQRQRPNMLRILVLIILVGLALYVNQVVVPATPPLFVPTPTITRAPESYVTEAEKLLAQGKMLPSIQTYKLAVQSDPKNVANYVTLARLLVFTGNYKEAVANAENALLLNPSHSMAHAVRGWALGLMEDYLGGEGAIKRALELDPNNGVAYAFLTEILVLQSQSGASGLGTMDKAIAASKSAMALSPNSLETHRARGMVLEITANYREAVAEFEAAIAINENIADLHLSLGRNYRFLQEYAKAVEEFNRANALNPADPLPDTYISRTYATVGEYAKAIQFGQQAIKDAPTDPYMYGNLGTLLYRNAQYKDAVEALRMSVRGGALASGEKVKGLPLAGGRVAEYYSSYTLALARVGECREAVEISQLVQQGVPNEETAVYNAQEAINMCQQLANPGSVTQRPAGTVAKQASSPTVKASSTPKPTATKKPSATPRPKTPTPVKK